MFLLLPSTSATFPLAQTAPQPAAMQWLPLLIGLVAVLLLAIAGIALFLLLRRPANDAPAAGTAASPLPFIPGPAITHPAPDYQPTSAMPRADLSTGSPPPDFQPTVAVPRANQSTGSPPPDFQPTVAVPRANQSTGSPPPDFQPTVAMPRASQSTGSPPADFQPTVAMPRGTTPAFPTAAPGPTPLAEPTQRLGDAAPTSIIPPAATISAGAGSRHDNDRTQPELPAVQLAAERWVVMVVAGDHAAQLELNVPQVRYSLGRATQDRRPDLALHNPRVSREHAWLQLSAQGPLLIAGAATHGTYVGRDRAALVAGEQRLLHTGESIWLSPDVELRIFRVTGER